MKRNSNSNESDGINSGGNAQGSNVPGRQRPIDETPRDGSPVGHLKTGSFDDLESWSREDFEAALPLYVGDDLDAQESARVDAWLVAHPEDQVACAASKQAAGALARYADFTKERETPDLWAGIRFELIENGMLEAASAGHSVGSGGRGVNVHQRPILGGPRWFQRKSVAAAAALLLTGSVGLFMMNRGMATDGSEMTPSGIAAHVAGSVAPTGIGPAEAGPVAVADTSREIAFLPGEELLSGEAGTAERPLVSSPVGHSLGGPSASGRARGKSQKLQLAQQGAERLIDDAPKGLLWQSNPWVETNQGLVRSSNGPQLTSGR